MALKENSKKVFKYVASMDGKNITANDIAAAIGSEARSVNGSVTSFQKKGLMERVPAVIELEDGSTKPVKFIKLTEAGKAFDPDATDDAE